MRNNFCTFAKKCNFTEMKRFGLAVLFAVYVVYADAQVFKGEIIGGFNISQVEGDQQVGYRKFGAHAGVGVMLPLNFKKANENYPWTVSMEILFNQKGARKLNYYHKLKDTIHADRAAGKFEYLLKLNYISVPVIFHFTDKDKWTIGLGVAYNRMFSSYEVEYDIPMNYDSVPRLNPNDFTALFDVRFRIWQQLKFGFRFEYSMFSLRTRHFPATIYTGRAETRKQYNNSLTFCLIYMLNEKKEDKTKKKEKTKKPYYY